MRDFFVYMLLCSDDSYYVGHTDNIARRISQHHANKTPCYTSKRLPVKVVYMQNFATRYEALAAERQIKRWSRAKKEALIQENWDKISKLAKKKFDAK